LDVTTSKDECTWTRLTSVVFTRKRPFTEELDFIIKIAELDCCHIIILSIYVPSTHAYTHVLRVSLDLPYEKGNTTIIEAPF
jgi:hypothetical protein